MTDKKPSGLELLRQPFPPHQISKLPKESKAQAEERRADRTKGVSCQICGGWHHRNAVHLDYVGHAALTDRLLNCDPQWSWEPVAFRDGLPAFDETGGLWIRLTVCGVSRLGYGHASVKPQMDAGAREKEVIGDALRNAGMRFGAALDLWHKGDLHLDDKDDEDDDQKSAKNSPRAVADDNRKAPAAKAAPAKATNGAATVEQRVQRLIATIKACETTSQLRKAIDLAAALMATLSTDAPKLLSEVETAYKARFNALYDAEQAQLEGVAA